MALIKCSECGKEFSDKADACPNCGNPNAKKETESVNVTVKKENGTWSVGKLVIGIISIVLFVIVFMQSCAVGLGNTITDSGETSGTGGIFCAVAMLIAGIITVVTRNSEKIGGSIASTIIYLLGYLIGASNAGSYKDLEVWSVICFWFAILHIVSIVITKRKAKKNQ